MADRSAPIARIRLSRSLPRLLALPLLTLAAGGAAIAAGLLLVPGVAGTAVAILGLVVVLVAVGGTIFLLSVRVDVEDAAICVGWLGGERIYPLSPGPVTRVRLRGESASRLRALRGGIGWQLGAATLRDEEAIEVVRLAPTETAIIVPTERGRLAIAAEDEGALLDALTRAARERQRFETLTRETTPDTRPADQPRIVVAAAVMTGMERAPHERGPVELRAAETVAVPAAAPSWASEAVGPTARRWRRPLPGLRRAPRPAPSAALLLLPLAGAGAAWLLATSTGRMPDPGTDLGRLTALGLVLAGPVTTVGAIVARVWWPRIVAVVVAGGLATAVFVGRSLLG